MGWIAIVQLIIGLAQGLSAGLTTAGAPKAILDAVQAGLKAFTDVHGQLVTKAQVDQITLDFKW